MYWKILLLTLSGVLAGHAANQTNTSSPVVQQHEKFSQSLTLAIAKAEPHKNIVVSPILLQSALSLVYYGSAGATAEQLRQALQYPVGDNKSDSIIDFSRLLGAGLDPLDVDVPQINEIFVQKNFLYEFNSKFVTNAQFLNVSVKNGPLNAKGLVDINYSILKRVGFEIGEVLPPSVASESLPFILVSALVFNVPWTVAFKSSGVHDIEFYSLGSSRNVPAMQFKGKLKYANLKDLGAKLIEVPFNIPSVSLLIFLPNERDGLPAVEKKLNSTSLSSLVRRLQPKEVKLTLPKLRVEYEEDLIDTLQSLGISDSFSENAVFSNMFQYYPGGSTAHITTVRQKVLLSLQEKGDNEQNNSFLDIIKFSKSITVDRPFYFIIKSSDVILLSGQIIYF